jgi:predicted ABC-type ATPase
VRSAKYTTLRNDTLRKQKPALFIIAGPLGAGKTTFYEAYLKEAFPTMVPGVKEQQQPFLADRRSFAVEDICVDKQLLDAAKAAGYTTKVLFISTEDANLNVGRLLVRMNRGGKAEAVSTVIDSYRSAMKNLAEVRQQADSEAANAVSHRMRTVRKTRKSPGFVSRIVSRTQGAGGESRVSA